MFCLFFRLKISSKTNKWPLRPFKAIKNLTMFPCFKLISFTLPLVGVGELLRICRVPFSVKITLKTHGEASGLQQRLSYSWVWCTAMTQSPQLSCLLYNVTYMFMSSCNRENNALRSISVRPQPRPYVRHITLEHEDDFGGPFLFPVCPVTSDCCAALLP